MGRSEIQGFREAGPGPTDPGGPRRARLAPLGPDPPPSPARPGPVPPGPAPAARPRPAPPGPARPGPVGPALSGPVRPHPSLAACRLPLADCHKREVVNPSAVPVKQPSKFEREHARARPCRRSCRHECRFLLDSGPVTTFTSDANFNRISDIIFKGLCTHQQRKCEPFLTSFQDGIDLNHMSPSRLAYEIKQHLGLLPFNPGPKISMLRQSGQVSARFRAQRLRADCQH